MFSKYIYGAAILSLVAITTTANATPIDPRTNSNNTIQSALNIDNYYYWTAGTSTTNRAALYTARDVFGLGSDFSKDWFLAPTADDVFIEYTEQGSTDLHAYINGQVSNANKSYYIDFAFQYDTAVSGGYSGGEGEFKLYDTATNTLQSTLELGGKNNKNGISLVDYANSDRLSGWFLTTKDGRYLGDFHVATTGEVVPPAEVPVPGSLVLLGMGLFAFGFSRKFKA